LEKQENSSIDYIAIFCCNHAHRYIRAFQLSVRDKARALLFRGGSLDKNGLSPDDAVAEFNPVPDRSRHLVEEYTRALERYVGAQGNSTLQGAVRIGEKAAKEGLGVYEVSVLHQRVGVRIFTGARRGKPSAGAFSCAACPIERKPCGGFGCEVRRTETFYLRVLSVLTGSPFTEESLATVAQQAREEEARRIARDLHDEASQLLAVVHLALVDMPGNLTAEQRERLGRVDRLLDQIEDQMRHFAHQLAPPMLAEEGLAPAVVHMAEMAAKRHGIAITVVCEPLGRLLRLVETACYRILQEGMNNAIKHAKPTEIQLRIRRQSGSVWCTVRDNGTGFAASTNRLARELQGFGLRAMLERVQELGGNLKIRSKPGKMTEVTARVPERPELQRCLTASTEPGFNGQAHEISTLGEA
jgi:signal transduction histidine kinase